MTIRPRFGRLVLVLISFVVTLSACVSSDAVDTTTTIQAAEPSTTTVATTTTTTTQPPTPAELRADPPWGLDTVDLPDDADGIAEVFAAMPAEVDGVPLEMTAPDEVTFQGADERHLQLRVLGVADIREFSGSTDMTVSDFLSVLVSSGELETAEFELDDSKPLVWVAATSRRNGDLDYVASWAVPDGEWLFSASADSPEALTELIHAFINAVQTKGRGN